MLIKTKAIVISSLKYQEKSLIVKCLTQSDGLKSYFVPNAFSAKKSNQKIAYFQQHQQHQQSYGKQEQLQNVIELGYFQINMLNPLACSE